MKINIGCGRDYREGWFNTDISLDTMADAYFDVGKEYLLAEPSCAEEIFISGVLEQIGPNSEFTFALNQCHYLLKSGGKLVIVVPNAKYAIAHRDPMDIRKFTPDTFRYFLNGTQEYRDYGSVYGFQPWSSLDIQENQRHILTVTMIK